MENNELEFEWTLENVAQMEQRLLRKREELFDIRVDMMITQGIYRVHRHIDFFVFTLRLRNSIKLLNKDTKSISDEIRKISVYAPTGLGKTMLIDKFY